MFVDISRISSEFQNPFDVVSISNVWGYFINHFEIFSHRSQLTDETFEIKLVKFIYNNAIKSDERKFEQTVEETVQSSKYSASSMFSKISRPFKISLKSRKSPKMSFAT